MGEHRCLLLETLDHVLNRGLVIAGEITIAVADIDLIFVGLNVMVTAPLKQRRKFCASGKNGNKGGMKLYAYRLVEDTSIDLNVEVRGIEGAARLLKIDDLEYSSAMVNLALSH